MFIWNATLQGADIASAATLTLGNDGNYHHITGTVGINAIGASGRGVGAIETMLFTGACAITHNGTSLILLGGASITTTAGMVITFVYEGSGNWREVDRASGVPANDAALVHLAGGETITGNKLFTGQFNASLHVITFASTMALDWNNGLVQQVTLTGASTFTFANPVAGARYTIQLIQDATGGRVVTWPTIKWAGGSAPTLSGASKIDLIELFYDGTNYCGAPAQNF